MRVLLDTNSLLDVLLDRQPFVGDSSAVWDACDTGRIVGYIPASTLTDVYYIARRAADLATARIAVGLCLAAFEICPNVQIACALTAGLDAVVTRNVSDFAAAPVLALT